MADEVEALQQKVQGMELAAAAAPAAAGMGAGAAAAAAAKAAGAAGGGAEDGPTAPLLRPRTPSHEYVKAAELQEVLVSRVGRERGRDQAQVACGALRSLLLRERGKGPSLHGLGLQEWAARAAPKLDKHWGGLPFGPYVPSLHRGHNDRQGSSTTHCVAECPCLVVTC